MTQDDYKAYLAEAQAATQAYDYRRALQAYADLLNIIEPGARDPLRREARLKALAERGRLLHGLKQPAAALAEYEKYRDEAGHNHHGVEALVRIGSQCCYLGQYGRAFTTQQKALDLADELNYTLGRAKAVGGLGLVFSRWGRMEEAAASFEESLALFEILGDTFQQAQTYNRLGVVYHQLGKLDRALEAYERSCRLALQVGEPGTETAILAKNNMGETYQELFDLERALQHHRDALALAQKINYPYTSDLYRNIGVELQGTGNVDDGVAHLYRALAASEESNEPEIELQVLQSLAMAEYRRGNTDIGLAHARQLKEQAERSGAQAALANALYLLGMFERETGDFAATEQLWQKGLFLAHETGQRPLIWRIHASLAEIAASDALARVHYQIASDVLGQIAEPIESESLRQQFLSAPDVKAVVQAARRR